MGNSHRWFLLACLFKLALLGAAALLGWLSDKPLLGNFHWTPRDAVVGALAASPPLVLFWWTLRSQKTTLAEIRGFLENIVRPIFGPWSLLQLAVISFLAGLCEESLFRGVIQARLASSVGPMPAIFLASLLFGLCHFVNWAYATVAAVIGFYLGLIWQFTGNLLPPIGAHALYDFAALVYFLRIRRPKAHLHARRLGEPPASRRTRS